MHNDLSLLFLLELSLIFELFLFKMEMMNITKNKLNQLFEKRMSLELSDRKHVEKIFCFLIASS